MKYISSVMSKPSGGVTVASQGFSLELNNLSKEEVEIFDAELDSLVKNILAERDIKALYENNVPFLLKALEVAKNEFDGRPFAGSNARSNEIGFTIIRPEHVGFSTWDGQNTAAGWGNWIGSVAVPVTMSTDIMITLLGMYNYDPSPKTSAVKATIGNTTFPVWYFEQSQRLGTATRIFEIPKKVWFEPSIQFSIRKKRDAIGSDSLALAGIAFVMGPTLVLESPTPTTPTTLTTPVV